MKYNIGDEAIINDGYSFDGEKGTIVGYTDTGYKVICPTCYAPQKLWPCTKKGLVLIQTQKSETKIVITRKGPKTIAQLYDGKAITKSAEARCHPTDTYDFATGAKLAFDRLMGAESKAANPVAEKPKEDKPEPVKLYYCAKPLKDWLTVGKVYESIHGRITVETGENFVDIVMRMHGYLYPLIKRPAKVGEWVYIVNPQPVGGQSYKSGDIFKITHRHQFWKKNVACDEFPNWLEDSEYLVLDGYHPESRYESMTDKELETEVCAGKKCDTCPMNNHTGRARCKVNEPSYKPGDMRAEIIQHLVARDARGE